MSSKQGSTLRRRAHFILDGAADNDQTARSVHTALVALVVLSVGAVVLESAPSIAAQYEPVFIVTEYIAVAAFTVEYMLRLWCAPEHMLYLALSPWAARWAFVRSGSALVDLGAILPFFASFFIGADLRILLFLRLLRYFKLARYSPGIRSLFAVLEAERKALMASASVLFGVVLFTSTAMHIAERAAQPEAFGSIPAAMWWSIQTIATVGYGDIIPVTPAGRMIAALTMVMGFVMLGLPVGIVATAFAEEIHRREFVITWSMVARVPLFASLDASSIAEIMRYLRAQSVPAGTVIARRGDEAHSMYFIASGEVEIGLPGGPVQLGQGQFFGEIAVLRKTRRTANVHAIQQTKLLALDAFDLHTIMRRNAEIRRGIEEVAASRADLRPRQLGDIIDAELSQRENLTPGGEL